MKKNLRVAITGSFGNLDIGDEAMLSQDLAFVRDSLGVLNENIFLFGHRPDYVSTYHRHPRECCFACSTLESNWAGVNEKKGWRYHLRQQVRPLRGRRPLPRVDCRLESLLRSCDLAVITGGGTVNTRDQGAGSLRRMHAMVSYFRHLGLPIFMSGQTIGPLGLYEEHDKLACEIVDAIDVLTVRDHGYSRRYLEVIGARPKHLMETCDDAYSLPYQDVDLPTDVKAWFAGEGDVAAINVTDYTAGEPAKRLFVARLAERLIDQWVNRLVLVSHHPNDLSNLYMVYDMIENSRKDRVLLPDTRNWRDHQLKKMISQCRLAVGGRYHFIVFAGTSNTPFVGMCGNHYSYIKQDGFARPLRLENFVLTEKETWDMEVVLDRVRKAMSTSLTVDEMPGRPSPSMELLQVWLSSRQ